MKFFSTAITEIIHQTPQIVRMGRSSCGEISLGVLSGVFPYASRQAIVKNTRLENTHFYRERTSIVDKKVYFKGIEYAMWVALE